MRRQYVWRRVTMTSDLRSLMHLCLSIFQATNQVNPLFQGVFVGFVSPNSEQHSKNSTMLWAILSFIVLQAIKSLPGWASSRQCHRHLPNRNRSRSSVSCAMISMKQALPIAYSFRTRLGRIFYLLPINTRSWTIFVYPVNTYTRVAI